MVIVAGWVVFWCYWLVAAWRVKPGNSRWSRYAGARIVIAIVVIYLVRTLGFRSHRVGEGPVLSGVGLALFVLGLALAVWARLIAVAVLGGFFIYSATREESYLTEQFPGTYPAYKRSTKMLIPFVF